MAKEKLQIELSEILEQDPKFMINWAKNVYAKRELSEEEVAISEEVNKFVKEADKYGSRQAKDSIAQLVLKIIETEVTNYPYEILDNVLSQASYEEFDKARIFSSPKNTLVARQSAPRTGNVKKSYINFTEGTTKETHLQIETEIRMSDLRRNGALGIATLTLFAIEEFNNAKFKAMLQFVDELKTVGGDGYFQSVGMTVTGADDFLGYLDDNNTTGGYGTVIGLSNLIRKLSQVKDVKEYSDVAKDEVLRTGKLTQIDNSILYPVKAGLKTGNGDKLLADNVLYGFCGTIGEQYTKGEMRTYVIEDGNSETISLKFTGVEFGVSITKPENIAKLVIE